MVTNTAQYDTCTQYNKIKSSSAGYSAVHNSRSMTPITWQAAVDDEEQRPQLQDIFEAAIDGNHV